jgi:hypothetical protein
VGSALDLVTASLSSGDPTNNPQVLDAAVTQLIGIMRAEGLDELVESF